MTIMECYEAMGGNFSDVKARLMTEDRVKKFALRFLNDKSFETLKASLDEGNYEEAFRAAHTLKGVCQNLGFDRLYRSVFEISEALRGGNALSDIAMLDAVATDYEATVSALSQLDQ